MPAVPLPAAATAALTARAVLSKLGGVVVLHTADEELRSATAMPTLVTRWTVCAKALPKTPAGDALASVEAAAAIFAEEADDSYYVLDLLLSKPTEESPMALTTGLTGVQIIRATVIGLLSGKSLEAIQSQLAQTRYAPTYEVVNAAIVRVASPSSSAAAASSPLSAFDRMMQQIEKDVRPLPASASQSALKNMIDQAGQAKSEDAVTFFFRELPFVLQQQH